MTTLHITSSSSVLITGLAHAQPHPQVWKISASGNVNLTADAQAHTNFPPAAFDDFSFNATQGQPDPVMTYQMSASAPTTPSGASAWARQYLSLTAPRDYPVSTGNLWNRAAYAAVGTQFTGVTSGKQQMIDAVQFEIDKGPFSTATAPSTYQPARQLQSTIYPDRLNYVTNPSFEVTNMLPAADASLETGLGSWTAVSNATVSQSTTQALDGTHSLRLSSTAAGEMGARTAAVTMQPGNLVSATASFRAGSVARLVRVWVFFLDASGSTLTAVSNPVNTNDSTSAWTTLTTTPYAAPAHTATAYVFVEALATGAGGELHYVDVISLNSTHWLPVGYLDAGVATTYDASNHFVGSNSLKVALDSTIVPRTPSVVGTTNLLSNPCGDLGDTFAPFDGVDAQIVHTISSANPLHGSHSIRISSVVSYGLAPGVTVFPGTGVFPGGDQGFITGPFPVTAGLPYTYSAYVMQDAGSTAQYTLHLRWLDVSFEPLAFAETAFAETGTYTRHSVTATAPAGAVYAEVAAYFPATIGAGYVIDVEGMQLEQASSASAYVLGTRAPVFTQAQWEGVQHTVTGIIPGEHYIAYARVKKDATVGNITAATLAGPSPGDTLPLTGISVGTNDTQDTIPVSGWSLISVPFIATTTSQTILIAVDQDTMPASHSTLNYWVDAVVVENGDTPGLYFDGSSGTDYLWETGGFPGLCRSYYYESRSMKNGIINLLLQEYTAAGTNIGAPVYAVPKIT